MMQEQKPTHRRHNRWHDYSEKCIYHITLVVKDRKPLLGNMVEVKDGDSATICPWMHQTEKDVEYYGKASIVYKVMRIIKQAMGCQVNNQKK